MPHLMLSTSLVHPSLNSSVVLELTEQDVNFDVVDYIVDAVFAVVDSAMHRPRDRTASRYIEASSFVNLVSDVLRWSGVKMPIVLVMLVYLKRVMPVLELTPELEHIAHEMTFLGAIILAQKYICDAVFGNRQWANFTCGQFTALQLGRFEVSFIKMLDFDTHITEADVLEFYPVFARMFPAMRHAFLFTGSPSPISPTSTLCSMMSPPMPETPPECQNASFDYDVTSLTTSTSFSAGTFRAGLQVYGVDAAKPDYAQVSPPAEGVYGSYQEKACGSQLHDLSVSLCRQSKRDFPLTVIHDPASSNLVSSGVPIHISVPRRIVA